MVISLRNKIGNNSYKHITRRHVVPLEDPFLELPRVVDFESLWSHGIAGLASQIPCKSEVSFHHLSVPQILVPPRLLSIVREVFDGSQTGSGDAEHRDDDSIGNQGLERNTHGELL